MTIPILAVSRTVSTTINHWATSHGASPTNHKPSPTDPGDEQLRAEKDSGTATGAICFEEEPAPIASAIIVAREQPMPLKEARRVRPPLADSICFRAGIHPTFH